MSRPGFLSGAALASLLLLAPPAGAGTIFTAADAAFGFGGVDAGGGSATTSGSIRALTVSNPPVDATSLFLDDVASCTDLGTDAGTCLSGSSLDASAFDILIVDVVVTSGSIDAIGIGASTVPGGVDPSIAGWMDSCSGLLSEPGNCRDAAAGQAPTGVSLLPGGGILPGGALFDFGTTARPDANNLNGGETSRRLFVGWLDTGDDAPLALGESAVFMISSGINHGVSTAIVPEPTTGLLLGLALAGLAAAGGRRRA